MRRYNPKYFVYLDLIGVQLYAKSKFNPTWSEFKPIGSVVDETKNMLILQQDSTIKQYIKNQFIFQCWLPQSNGDAILLQFDGQKIVGRPETRIKQIRKNRRKYH